MARVNLAKTSFAAGQLSPRVSRRIDIEQYFNGASLIENFVCLPFGGVEKSPGTVFVKEARDSDDEMRLIDFTFNRRNAYILAFNDGYIRFFKDRGIITGANAITITGITNANPGVVTAVAHGLSNGDTVIMQGVDGMTEVNGVEYTVANKTTDTFELSGVNTTSYGTFILSSLTKLLIHGNATLVDSTGTHTLTANGDAALTADIPNFGTGAARLDGSGDYIEIPDSSQWDFGTGDYTIEGWFRWTAAVDNGYLIYRANGGGNVCDLQYESGVLYHYTMNSSLSASFTPVAGTWYHIAATRSGTDRKLYVNGVVLASDTNSSNVSQTTPYLIGASSGPANEVDIYTRNIRFSNIARYTTGFKAPTADFSTDANTLLLLLLNSDFSDSTGTHTPTANGGAFITNQSKFGAGSILFDGTGDYISIPDHADWDFGTGDFTWDFWVRFKARGADIGLFSRSDSEWSLQCTNSNLLRLQINSSIIKSETWNPSLNTWYHVAVTRSGTNLRFFVDGTQLGSATTNSDSISGSNPIQIGANNGSGAIPLNGWIDEFRVMKAYARYTANFTPPTSESPVGTATTVSGIYEITQPYDNDELFDIQTAQASDIMYLAHPDNPPMKLSRFADNSWTLADVVFIDGPYLDENVETTTLDPSGTSGSVTVVASSIVGINDGTGFQTTDVGRLIKYHDGTDYFWMVITARASTTSVTATIKWKSGTKATTTMGGHAASTRWSLGSFSATTGYPHAVTFHQSRLWFAGTDAQPQSVWGSVIEDYENFLAGAADDDAVVVTLGTNRVNIIEWLASEKRLIVGTAEQMFTLYAGTVAAEGITPDNVKADPETNYGTAPVVPEQIGSLLYYVGADTKKIREFAYGFDIDRYRSVDRQILADDITGTGIVEMAFQKSPYGVLYCVLSNGDIATLTREVDQQVNAWTKQTTDGNYESVAVIPTTGYDEVWFVVKRTINGSTKRYIEYQANPNQAKDANIEDQILLHSTLTYDSSPVSTVTGLSHLEAKAVHALCDGVKVTGTVASGSLALGASYSTVQVGLPVTASIKLLPPEAGSQQGSAQGLMKRCHEILVSVYRTLGLKVGEENGNLEAMRTGAGAIPTTLQTDDFTFPGTIGWDRKNQIYLEAPDPHPCTILLMVMLLQVNEK